MWDTSSPFGPTQPSLSPIFRLQRDQGWQEVHFPVQVPGHHLLHVQGQPLVELVRHWLQLREADRHRLRLVPDRMQRLTGKS